MGIKVRAASHKISCTASGRPRSIKLQSAVAAFACLLPLQAPDAAVAAELSARFPAPVVEQPVLPPAWTIQFTPYAWLTSLNGSQTVRGRTVDVNETFLDLVHDTWGKGNQLFAAMAHLEARNGPLALFGDGVWARLDIEGGGIRERRIAPEIRGAIAARGDLKYKMAIAEAGAAYEIARFGFPFGDVVRIPAALDVLAGARYWYQEADVSFDIRATVDIADLIVLGRNRAIARSGSVDWTDPFVGARLRFAVAPGQELFVRGDVGGFDVGSKFSWQAIAGYTFDCAVWNGITVSGLLGYRALYVDYAQGFGRRLYEFDMLQHGPLIGLSLRW
jgi:hypothetical protein